MNLTNSKLISLVQKLGEEKTHTLLVQKMNDDDARREYHRKYNQKKNEMLKVAKQLHPELFKIANA